MRGSAIIAGCLLLGGCGLSGSAVPHAVQAAIDAPFPDDGQIHARSRGRFVVEPDTMFCRDPSKPGMDTSQLKQLFDKLAQPQNFRNGSYFRGNGKIGLDEECASGEPVFHMSSQSPNRTGNPYKLVLAVWQGDPAKGGAYWVGGLERHDGVRPDQRGTQPFRDGLPPLTNLGKRQQDREDQLFQTSQSQGLDVQDLSLKFTLAVSGRKE